MQPRIYVGRGMHESQFVLIKWVWWEFIFMQSPTYLVQVHFVTRFFFLFQVYYFLAVTFMFKNSIQLFCPGWLFLVGFCYQHNHCNCYYGHSFGIPLTLLHVLCLDKTSGEANKSYNEHSECRLWVARIFSKWCSSLFHFIFILLFNWGFIFT